MFTERVGDRLGVLFAEERKFIAKKAIQFLAGKRQERGEQDLERVDRLQGSVNGQSGRVFISLDRLPGRQLVEVLVDGGCQAKSLLQGGAQFYPIQEFANCPEAGLDAGQQFQVGRA